MMLRDQCCRWSQPGSLIGKNSACFMRGDFITTVRGFFTPAGFEIYSEEKSESGCLGTEGVVGSKT